MNKTQQKKTKVVMMIANSSYTPYFRYFAEHGTKEGLFDFTFIFLHFEKPLIVDELKQIGATTIWLPFDYRKEKKIQYLKLTFSLFRIFRKIKPDIVHTNLFDDSLPGMLAAKWARVKKRIITKQDTMFHFLYAKKGMKFDKINNKNATHIVAVSEESREFIANIEKADLKKLSVIHHGVVEDEFTGATEEEKNYVREKYNSGHKLMIGTVSRLVESKGYKFIIDAMEILKKKRNDIIFVGAGNGSHRELYDKLIREKNLEKDVILAGHIDKKYIPAFYQSLSVYVHASIYEPFGFVIPEAIFNRIPVVTTNTGASRDALKHLESAYLVKTGDPSELADGIEYMLTHDTSVMVTNAYKKAKEMYTMGKMWQNYRSLYLND